MIVKISKFDVYPKEKPTGYAIGFNSEFNSKELYKDILIPFEDTTDKTKEEIVKLAWERLKDNILTKVISMDDTYPKVGDIWEPPNIEEDIVTKISELGLKEEFVIDDTTSKETSGSIEEPIIKQ